MNTVYAEKSLILPPYGYQKPMKKDVVIYFVGKFIPAFVNLFMIVLVVRFLGEDQYGKYSLIVYLAILITQLCFTWIQQSMIRFLSFYKEKPGEILSRLFFLTVLSTLLAALIMFLVCLFYFSLNFHELLIVVFYTSMYIFFIFRLTLYQAFMKPVKYAAYESVYSISLLFFLLGFIYFIAYKKLYHSVHFHGGRIPFNRNIALFVYDRADL